MWRYHCASHCAKALNRRSEWLSYARKGGIRACSGAQRRATAAPIQYAVRMPSSVHAGSRLGERSHWTAALATRTVLTARMMRLRPESGHGGGGARLFFSAKGGYPAPKGGGGHPPSP